MPLQHLVVVFVSVIAAFDDNISQHIIFTITIVQKRKHKVVQEK